MAYSFIKGTPGVSPPQITHLIIPGRYRSADGIGLSTLSRRRVDTAAEVFRDYRLAEQGGIIACSGYKTPRDHAGGIWYDEHGIEYEGIPEAYSMQARLMGRWGLDKSHVRIDTQSVDTVTNFINSQTLLPDERPVGIVAQKAQLKRILTVIAPRVLRNPYVGIVVPELLNQIDVDGLGANLVSRWVVRGFTPETADASLAEARVQGIWAGINLVKSFPHMLQRGSSSPTA